MLDLSFTDEQQMLREAVGGLCDDKAPLESVRALENDAVGYSSDFWEQLAALGLAGALVPERYGGSGMGLLDCVVMYEEFGRTLAPSPHFVSSVISVGVLTRSGSDRQKDEWLPRISSSDAIVTPAWLEPDNSSGPTGVQMRAVAAPSGGFTLNGIKRHAFFAEAADAFIVPARTEAPSDERSCGGVDLFLVAANAPGVTLRQQRSVAYDTQFEVTFDDVTVDESHRIGAPGTGWDTWHAAMLDAAVLAAAQAVGGARRVHEITCEYAKQRVQFDKPLAAFQSINHYLADGITEVDGAAVLVHQAAWARDDGRSIEKLAPMAKLFATEVYRKMSGVAIQVHGGMGFTVECDAQLYFRRAKSLELNWFDPPHLEQLIAAQVLDT
jgi:alkylation response protein AidB-like acyl-CoA dehydrogenase